MESWESKNPVHNNVNIWNSTPSKIISKEPGKYNPWPGENSINREQNRNVKDIELVGKDIKRGNIIKTMWYDQEDQWKHEEERNGRYKKTQTELLKRKTIWN